MTRLLHLVLEIEEDRFDDDYDMQELVDVLEDNRDTKSIVELRTAESDKADFALDDTGESISCYVKSVGFETVLD